MTAAPDAPASPSIFRAERESRNDTLREPRHPRARGHLRRPGHLASGGRDGAGHDGLEGGEGRATREIADAIGLSTRSTRTRLARLVKRGLVREVGTGPYDPRRVYVIALD